MLPPSATALALAHPICITVQALDGIGIFGPLLDKLSDTLRFSY